MRPGSHTRPHASADCLSPSETGLLVEATRVESGPSSAGLSQGERLWERPWVTLSRAWWPLDSGGHP